MENRLRFQSLEKVLTDEYPRLNSNISDRFITGARLQTIAILGIQHCNSYEEARPWTAPLIQEKCNKCSQGDGPVCIWNGTFHLPYVDTSAHA